MKYCSYCGKEIAEKAVVCIHCGAAVMQDNPIKVSDKPVVMTNTNVQSIKTNALCVVGFIMSFFVGIVGLILSCIGLTQAKNNKENGTGLAIAGIVLSCLAIIFHIWLFIVLTPYILVMIFYVFVGILMML